MDKKEKTEEACTCNEGNCCCCCKCNKKVFKILGLIIIFLAGMGFDSLLNPCRCPNKGPRPLPNAQHHDQQPMPGVIDGQSGTVIIINTDGANRGISFAGKPFRHEGFDRNGKDEPRDKGDKFAKEHKKGENFGGKHQPKPQPQHEGEHASQPAPEVAK